MKYAFSRRIQNTPKSFIREILKVTENPDVISFAGGLPNPSLIDTEGIGKAAYDIIKSDGRNALQYSTTEGYEPLRRYIADRYRARYDLDVSPDEILITNGSQQCLDLIGKVFIDKGDAVLMEKPGYLGAIQAFSLYEPEFHSVPLEDDGPDTKALSEVLSEESPAFFYGIPNSQNPTGISYSDEKRREVAEILSEADVPFIEDDAYGELRFDGKAVKPVKYYMPGNGVMTGSFSKIFSPGMRLGWICADKEILEKVIIAKQASDLHSNYLSQRILYKYLEDNDIDAHIKKINVEYRARAELMVETIRAELPPEITCTQPEGGMFVWLRFPDNMSSMKIFEKASERNVVILPGVPFYIDGNGEKTARINFTNADEDEIKRGIGILADVIKELYH